MLSPSKITDLESGEVVEYSAETTQIQGLSTTSSYYINKLTNDTFQLADAGIGGTSTINFNRGKYVNFIFRRRISNI